MLFVPFVVSVLCVFVVRAQGDATDADLERASAGRVVRVGNLTSGRVSAIPLETYVARVLAGEGEPRAAGAAQQALAVAIRTYVVVNTGRHRRDGYDLCDSTHCQVLRAATAITRRAALATAGQALTFEGRPAEVFYSASCGGQSEAASEVWPSATYPYLRSAPDDVHDDDAPWTLDLTLREIEAALKRAGFAGARLTSVEIDARSPSGRVTRLRLAGLVPPVIAGEPFRAAIGATTLRSTAFTATRTADTLHFVGRGYGHGIGMCVIGAGRRATRGESFRAILAQYYPGLELTRVDALVTRATAPPVTAPPPTVRPAPGSPAAASAATRAPAAVAVPPPATTVIPPRPTTVIVRRPGSGGPGSSGQGAAPPEIEQLAARAHADLSRTLGVSIAPVTIELHDTLDAFRLATGQPWWVSAVAAGTTIDLAPLTVLAQRDGLDRAIRAAIADLLVAGPLAGRPAWVRTGAARYFAQPAPAGSASARLRCPADAELKLAISAAAQREAESRAEACFAREYEKTRDWRVVR